MSGVGLLNQFTQTLVVSADDKIDEAIKRANTVWSTMKKLASEKKKQIEAAHAQVNDHITEQKKNLVDIVTVKAPEFVVATSGGVVSLTEEGIDSTVGSEITEAGIILVKPYTPNFVASFIQDSV